MTLLTSPLPIGVHGFFGGNAHDFVLAALQGGAGFGEVVNRGGFIVANVNGVGGWAKTGKEGCKKEQAQAVG